jgi:chemotaxis protein histidine kinase CheA
MEENRDAEVVKITPEEAAMVKIAEAVALQVIGEDEGGLLTASHLTEDIKTTPVLKDERGVMGEPRNQSSLNGKKEKNPQKIPPRLGKEKRAALVQKTQNAKRNSKEDHDRHVEEARKKKEAEEEKRKELQKKLEAERAKQELEETKKREAEEETKKVTEEPEVAKKAKGEERERIEGGKREVAESEAKSKKEKKKAKQERIEEQKRIEEAREKKALEVKQKMEKRKECEEELKRIDEKASLIRYDHLMHFLNGLYTEGDKKKKDKKRKDKDYNKKKNISAKDLYINLAAFSDRLLGWYCDQIARDPNFPIEAVNPMMDSDISYIITILSIEFGDVVAGKDFKESLPDFFGFVFNQHLPKNKSNEIPKAFFDKLSTQLQNYDKFIERSKSNGVENPLYLGRIMSRLENIVFSNIFQIQHGQYDWVIEHITEHIGFPKCLANEEIINAVADHFSTLLTTYFTKDQEVVKEVKNALVNSLCKANGVDISLSDSKSGDSKAETKPFGEHSAEQKIKPNPEEQAVEPNPEGQSVIIPGKIR